MNEAITDEELLSRFRGHPLTRDNATHYRARLERRLVLNRCRSCGHWHQPPKPICPACWSSDIEAADVRGSGVIDLAMFLYQGPAAEGVDYTNGYPVVSVALDEQEGLRFTSTVVDAAKNDVVIGARVELDWIERAGAPLPVFRLAR